MSLVLWWNRRFGCLKISVKGTWLNSYPLNRSKTNSTFSSNMCPKDWIPCSGLWNSQPFKKYSAICSNSPNLWLTTPLCTNSESKTLDSTEIMNSSTSSDLPSKLIALTITNKLPTATSAKLGASSQREESYAEYNTLRKAQKYSTAKPWIQPAAKLPTTLLSRKNLNLRRLRANLVWRNLQQFVITWMNSSKRK